MASLPPSPMWPDMKPELMEFMSFNDYPDPVYETYLVQNSPPLYQTNITVGTIDFKGGEYRIKSDAENSAAKTVLLCLGAKPLPDMEQMHREYRELWKNVLRLLGVLTAMQAYLGRIVRVYKFVDIQKMCKKLLEELEGHVAELHDHLRAIEQRI